MPSSPALDPLDAAVLTLDRRCMTQLHAYLPPDTVMQAARLALANRTRVMITTGFYLTRYRAIETDGPPGALAIGRALAALGAQVVYVTDQYADSVLQTLSTDHGQVICFPIADIETSRVFARRLLEEIQPTLLVSVERCGLTVDGTHRNWRDADISAFTAKADLLFEPDIPSIGIGDGGNEIGMGNLAGVIPAIPGLPAHPAVTRASVLIAASVSNWGAYGLAAGLSCLAGRDLLPGQENESRLLQRLFDQGCYDGTCDQPTCGIDGYTLEENAVVIRNLKKIIHR